MNPTQTLSPEALEAKRKQEAQLNTGPTSIGASILAEMYDGIGEYKVNKAQIPETVVVEQVSERGTLYFNGKLEANFENTETIVVNSTPKHETFQVFEQRKVEMPHIGIPKEAIKQSAEEVVKKTTKVVKASWTDTMEHIVKDLFWKQILGFGQKPKKEVTPEEKAKIAEKRSFMSRLRESANIFQSNKRERAQKEAARLEISMNPDQINARVKNGANLSYQGGDSIYDLHATSHAQEVAKREELKRREAPVSTPSKKASGPGVEMNKNKQEGLNSVQKLHG
jgi:hypothetical protein